MANRPDPEVVWALFLASRAVEPTTPDAKRAFMDLGGAAKRLFPGRYKLYFVKLWQARDPDGYRASCRARARRWARRHPEKVRENNARALERLGGERRSNGRVVRTNAVREAERAYYAANRERILAKQRAAVERREGRTIPHRELQPLILAPNGRRQAAVDAERRYKAKIGKEELARRERERRKRLG